MTYHKEVMSHYFKVSVAWRGVVGGKQNGELRCR